MIKYNPETGRLERMTKHGWTSFGWIHTNGQRQYYRVFFNGRMQYAHRIVWWIVAGRWPEGEIDHIDGDGTNNRFENLRDVPPALNQRNRRLNPNNTTGLPGVGWRRGKYQVRPAINGKRVYVGLYATFDEAEAALKAFHAKHGFHANHGAVR